MIIIVILSLQCPKRNSSKSIRKNGHSTFEHQRYQYTDCRHTFQEDYSMKGAEAGMYEKIVAMTINNSGCRERARILCISLNMVLKHQKN